MNLQKITLDKLIKEWYNWEISYNSRKNAYALINVHWKIFAWLDNE